MGTGVTGGPASLESPRGIPTTGMRGGLGRTLLTAFLILTVLPLGVVGGYAVQQNRHNLELEVGSRLLSIATLKGERLLGWFEELQVLSAASMLSDEAQSSVAYDAWWQSFSQDVPDLAGVSLLSRELHPIWSTEACQINAERSPFLSGAGERGKLPSQVAFLQPGTATQSALAVVVVLSQERTLVLCLRTAAVERMLETDAGIGETGRVSLVQGTEIWPAGEPSYYPVAEIGGGILVEQSQHEILAATERMVATLIAMILAVALATTVISAVVIRQITRPVIDLTESAVAMAGGNLDQHVDVRSRDEIGILTYVFNEMAAELKSLYRDLEAKVVERTKRLQQANYQIQRRALHLQASQQIGQAITSIRDPERLLTEVTDLICSHFVYSSVAVYLLAPGGGEARLQVCSPRPGPELVNEQPLWLERCRAGDGSTVGRAIRKGSAQLHNEPAETELGWYSRMLSRVAIPLKMEDRIVGVIAVITTAHEGIQPDELEVLEVLASQVTIALENARAYERERLAMEQLEAAEAFKARFLANMSRELREPLNAVIGFSRLLIKGLDGPLNSRQQEDLDQIHADSQRLLYLINDILAISQIQAGLMELRLQPVELAGLVAGMMPTASALVNGKDIAVRQEIPVDLPLLYGDPARLRQVLVHLLTNAVKFTESGRIVIRAWANEEDVYVSVSDTGVGIPVEDRERIFAYFEKGSNHRASGGEGVGLGLALCREYVELHGGQLWVDSDVGTGSTFTFSVPAYALEISETGGRWPASAGGGSLLGYP